MTTIMKAHNAYNLKKIAIFFVMIITVVSLCPIKTLAVAPANIITYQGRLLDTDGVPEAAASVDVVFTLYDSLAAGTCLWSNSSATCATTTTRVVTLTDGLFSENLGDTTLAAPYAAISSSVFADNAAVYLEVIVEGETLTPRKRLTAAPYAVNAQIGFFNFSPGFKQSIRSQRLGNSQNQSWTRGFVASRLG